MTSESVTWSLSEEEYRATVAKLAKINARAARRGFTGRFDIAVDTRVVNTTGRGGVDRKRTVYETTITGIAPSYNGWTFVAAVDSIDSETGDAFILRSAPGVKDAGIDRSSLVAGQCVHCGVNRPNRKYTYLVRHDDGRVSQVGSTCVKDFTGWSGRPVFIGVDEVRAEIDSHLEGVSAAPEYESPESVIAITWAITRVHGWVSSSSADSRVATRHLVSKYLFGRGKSTQALIDEVAEHLPAARAIAPVIIDTLTAGLTRGGDYAENLLACLGASEVADKHLGLVASAVAAYERIIGEKARREVAAKRHTERRGAVEHLGRVGDRVEFTGIVCRLVAPENDFGPSMMVIAETSQHVVKLFTASKWVWDLEVGDELSIVATVKEHGEYRGTKQTLLNRPRLMSPPS